MFQRMIFAVKIVKNPPNPPNQLSRRFYKLLTWRLKSINRKVPALLFLQKVTLFLIFSRKSLDFAFQVDNKYYHNSVKRVVEFKTNLIDA